MLPRYFAALAVAASITACGGGGSATDVPAQADAAAAPAPGATASPAAPSAPVAATPAPAATPAASPALVAYAPASVNTATAGYQKVQSIAPLAGGGYAIAWTSQDTAGTAFYVQRFDAQGARVGGETRLVAASPDASALAVLRDGSAVVATAQGSSVVAQRFDANGTALGAATTLAAGGSLSQPVLEPLDDGGFAAGWASAEAGGTAQHAQHFDAAARAAGTPVDFAAAGADRNLSLRLVAAPGGNFVAGTTHRFNGIGYWQFRIGAATVGALDDADAGLPELNTTLLALPDGRFALWSTGSAGGWRQVLDAAGRAIGGTTPVAVTPETAVTLPGGGWATITRQMPGLPFLAQRFDTGGNAVGASVEMATGISRPLGASAVGAGFTLAWTTAVNSGDTDVKMQRVDAP